MKRAARSSLDETRGFIQDAPVQNLLGGEEMMRQRTGNISSRILSVVRVLYTVALLLTET